MPPHKTPAGALRKLLGPAPALTITGADHGHSYTPLDILIVMILVASVFQTQGIVGYEVKW